MTNKEKNRAAFERKMSVIDKVNDLAARGEPVWIVGPDATALLVLNDNKDVKFAVIEAGIFTLFAKPSYMHSVETMRGVVASITDKADSIAKLLSCSTSNDVFAKLDITGTSLSIMNSATGASIHLPIVTPDFVDFETESANAWGAIEMEFSA
jgi:hypothetical protein